MQRSQLIKVSLLVISLFALAACSSTSETDDSDMGNQGSSSSSGSSSASSSAGSSSGQLSQEEIRAQNALRQTVFYFDFDVAEFKPQDRDTLTYHARDLAANPGKRVRLEGHADERGTREYNLALGERRANGILNYFIVNGASRSQIETVSYGEERPSQRGSTEQAYSRNRRVEVVAR
ncbi:MAG: peptidoglycan-associated lipoprotein Pal [Gammaproteobacteria bacterium]|jgi:peptidoglycan-associated lipoprotein|nr:peptidoglycan-associated lipoprotein Pal [Gammaproteobacteria bacterium]MDP6536060.1 peptidoglycan-associated lipoprotein Pal [Gammaproteobacteria bacterium]MDP6732004.1 peptidoglycan-associated lipoprotein Pal [Gammaproteobacteria bacterium]HAJ75213.1 peptidoglycan-associated lipoprotein Pal [Gammaproteobacteria bacterium]|tara:strand:+ start:564 stop:1097 length:534 start_codon:yes stop_codon:yes gene_type:complete